MLSSLWPKYEDIIGNWNWWKWLTGNEWAWYIMCILEAVSTSWSTFFFFAFHFVGVLVIPSNKLPEVPSYLLIVLSINKATFQPKCVPFLSGDESHYGMQRFICFCKIITPLSHPRLVIWINVCLIKLAAGLSLRNKTIRSHGTRAQKGSL